MIENVQPISKKVRKSGLATSKTGRVFMAPDHVLLAIEEHFAEEYRRFYYRDIQAINILRTKRREIMSMIGGGITLAWGLLLLLALVLWSWSLSAIVTLMVPWTVVLIATLVNYLKGPTCKLIIKTAVGTQEMFPITRYSEARRFLNAVLPRVRSAQGEG